MSSSSENGSENGSRGRISQCQSPGSNSGSPSPTSSIKQRSSATALSSDADENEFKSSKNSSPSAYRSGSPEGVLTPPKEADGQENISDCKEEDAAKSNGRLKFFKDGMLCLELSHHDEGKKTKWVQIRGRSSIPQIVPILKEAVIPSQFHQPLIFPSNSPTNSNNHILHPSSRVESTTSHSMSDDGSSMLSSASPRTRDSNWRKQPVPQKLMSSSFPPLDFYMKPASCILSLNFRQEIQLKAPFYTRRPYSLPNFIKIFSDKVAESSYAQMAKSIPSSPCLCDVIYLERRTKDGGKFENGRLNGNSDTKLRNEKKRKPANISTLEKRLSELVDKRLKLKREKEAAKIENSVARNNNCCSAAAAAKTPSPVSANPPLPKLSKKEREMISSFRPLDTPPKKAVLVGQTPEKTILTVPFLSGLATKNRQVDPITMDHALNMSLMNLPLNFSKSASKYGAGDTTDGKLINNFSSSSEAPSRLKPNTTTTITSRDSEPRQRNSRKSSKSSNHSHGNFSKSPMSILKPGLKSPPINSNANSSPYGISPSRGDFLSRGIPYSPPPRSSSPSPPLEANHHSPEQERYLSKQTVSRVISYTINSLLGTPDVPHSNGISSSKKFGNSPYQDSVSPRSRKTPPSPRPTEDSNAALKRKGHNLFSPIDGVGGEEEKGSFLRHLLDTSDPIPSATPSSPPTSKIPPTPPKKRSAINSGITSSSSNHNSISPAKSRRSSPKTNHSSSSNSHSVNNSLEATSIVIPKPLAAKRSSHPPTFSAPLPSPQERSIYNHYTSLLPANFAVAHAHSQSSSSSRLSPPEPYYKSSSSGPPDSRRSPLNYSAGGGDLGGALNLSQRGCWPPFLLGLSPASFHDRASNGCQDLSMRRNLSPYLTTDNQNCNGVDDDLPLNLCKKPRPN